MQRPWGSLLLRREAHQRQAEVGGRHVHGQPELRSETLSEVPKKGKEVLELALLPLEHLNQDKYYLMDPMNNHSCSTAAGDGTHLERYRAGAACSDVWHLAQPRLPRLPSLLAPT